MGYPSDLSNLEWEQIKDFFEVDYSKGGRPPKHSRRAILDAIFYIAKTGCQWRYLPKEYPPWTTVHTYFRKWRKIGLFERMNNQLRKHLRGLIGREEDPSAGMVDSQSVKTAEKGGLEVLIMAKKSKVAKGI
jgi:transposase